MSRFIKPDALNSAKTMDTLFDINVEANDNLLNYKKLDIGFTTAEGMKKSAASARDRL